MKNLPVIILVTGVLFFYSCQQNKKDDPEKLKAVLTGYFDAIKARDFQKMKDLSTEDFVLFEDGMVFNNDSLINLISTMPNAVVDYKFENFIINVDQNTGNMRYYNQGEFTINDTIHLAPRWLESATFKKIGNDWKLEFLHSTVRK
jgi:hypothetical protein